MEDKKGKCGECMAYVETEQLPTRSGYCTVGARRNDRDEPVICYPDSTCTEGEDWDWFEPIPEDRSDYVEYKKL